MAEICVKAVIAVADLERKDVNLELIKVEPLFDLLNIVLMAAKKVLTALRCTYAAQAARSDVQSSDMRLQERA